jgi:phospholipid/cholesterol/gamma-HCH transport system ATP-binding protein
MSDRRPPPRVDFLGVRAVLDGEVVLDDVTFAVPAGRTTVLMGPSGAGRTTVLRHLLGLRVPDRGRVTVDGAEVATLAPAELDALRRRTGVLLGAGPPSTGARCSTR